MKEEKGKNILIGVLICIIILLTALIVLLVTNNKNLSNKVDNENNQNNETIEEDNNTATNAQHNLNGTYTNKSENENSYHSASIEITNQTDNTIDFKLEAAHGTDSEHVNIGNVNGTANKIDNNTYEFEEEIDGQISKISFKFNDNKVTITENYPDNINPFAGHGVYFSGDYEKVS